MVYTLYIVLTFTWNIAWRWAIHGILHGKKSLRWDLYSTLKGKGVPRTPQLAHRRYITCNIPFTEYITCNIPFTEYITCNIPFTEYITW